MYMVRGTLVVSYILMPVYLVPTNGEIGGAG